MTPLLRALEFTCARPRATWALALLVAALAGVSALGIQFDDDVTRLFVHEDESATALARFNATFPTEDTVLAVLVESPRPHDLRSMAVIDRLSEQLAALDGAEQLQSATHSDVARSVGDALVTSPAFGRQSVDGLEAAERRALLRAQRPLGPRLLSEDGTITALLVRPEPSLRTNADLRELAERVRTLSRNAIEASAQPLKVHFAGIPYTRLASMEVMQRDLLRLTPLTVLAVLALVALTLRSVRATLLALAPVGVSVVLLLGLMAAAGLRINPLSAVLPALLVVMALADSMHLVHRYLDDDCVALPTPWQRTRHVLRRTGKACALTTFTTAVGFGSLWMTHVPILREFGLLAALGMVLSLGVQVLLISSGSRWLEGLPSHSLVEVSPRLARFPTWLSSPGVRAAVTAVGVVALAAAFAGSSRIRLDNYLSDALVPAHPVSVANRVLDSHLGGMMPLELWLRTPEEGTFERFEGVQALDRLGDSLQREHGIESVFSAAAIYRDVQRAVTSDDGPLRDAETLGELRMLADSAGAVDMASWVSDDGRQARILFFAPDVGARKLLALGERIETSAAALLAGSSITSQVTGVPLLASTGTNALAGELLRGLGVSILLITLTLGLVLRSLRAAVASLLPNLLPVMTVAAWYGWTGRFIDPVPAISFTVAIGIAVDDTIHLTARYLEELRGGADPGLAVTRAWNACLKPVLWSSMALSVGFSLLVLSEFPPNRSFGLLVAASMVLALVVDLTLTPAVLAWLRPGSRRQPARFEALADSAR